jgi:molecular chaperone DnaK (HSP70)
MWRVTDFGGGTFDVSVIETTAAGDISRSGRNSKPLAARSIPIGGFAINAFIADPLLFKSPGRGVDKTAVRKAIEVFPVLRNLNDEELSAHRADHVAFARNYHRLLQSVEQAKIAVCNSVTTWRLNADLKSSAACPVDVPLHPFQDGSPSAPVRLEPTDLRAIYEDRVWKQKLLPAIRETLKRADAELGGKPISIVLLSGGSSNIRWLKPLMERDVPDLRGNAEILELSENFQEIVAKGLAVECARRFYTEGQGDFRAVTYNRLCLGLNPNGNGFEFNKKYVPESAELKGVESEPGVLLPSSTSLRGGDPSELGAACRWPSRLS